MRTILIIILIILLPDPLANGTALNRARSLNRGKQFGLNQLFLAASRSFLIRSCVFLISEY